MSYNSSDYTKRLQERTLYANYIAQKQRAQEGCATRLAANSGPNADSSSSAYLTIQEGALVTTVAERDAILADTSCAGPQSGSYTLTLDGLVLYYDMGDTASYPGSGTSISDLSPSDFTGTLENGPTFNAANGGSLSFNGINTYIDTNQLIESPSFTLQVWFNATSNLTDYRMLISKERPLGGPWNYRFYLEAGTGYLVGDIEGGTAPVLLYSQNLCDNRWHMGTFSWDDATETLKLYVDGILGQSGNQSLTGSTSNSQSVWIGRSAYSGTDGYPFLGKIGAALIYDRALTDAEVYENYLATNERFI
jgi:hypothetical protein